MPTQRQYAPVDSASQPAHAPAIQDARRFNAFPPHGPARAARAQAGAEPAPCAAAALPSWPEQAAAWRSSTRGGGAICCSILGVSGRACGLGSLRGGCSGRRRGSSAGLRSSTRGDGSRPISFPRRLTGAPHLLLLHPLLLRLARPALFARRRLAARRVHPGKHLRARSRRPAGSPWFCLENSERSLLAISACWRCTGVAST